MLRFQRLWQTIGWVLILAVVILSLWPKAPQTRGFQLRGQIGHVFAYMVLVLWFANIYPRKKQRIWLSLIFIGMGISLEYIQRLTGYRKFEYIDITNNIIGVLFGWLLAASRLGTCLVELDNLLSRFVSRTE